MVVDSKEYCGELEENSQDKRARSMSGATNDGENPGKTAWLDLHIYMFTISRKSTSCYVLSPVSTPAFKGSPGLVG